MMMTSKTPRVEMPSHEANGVKIKSSIVVNPFYDEIHFASAITIKAERPAKDMRPRGVTSKSPIVRTVVVNQPVALAKPVIKLFIHSIQVDVISLTSIV